MRGDNPVLMTMELVLEVLESEGRVAVPIIDGPARCVKQARSPSSEVRAKRASQYAAPPKADHTLETRAIARLADDAQVALILAMTVDRHNFAFSRRDAPEFCIFVTLENRGRREDRVRAAPAVSWACAKKYAAHEHTGSAESTPAFPAQWLYGLYAIFPVTRLFCHHRPLESFRLSRT